MTILNQLPQSDTPFSGGSSSQPSEIRLEQLSPQLIKELAQLGKDSLYFFCKGILGFSKLDPNIHGPICEMLERYEDPEFHNLLFVLPRGWFKTTVVSIGYPLWRATRNPNMTILIAQNTSKNAVAKLASLGDHVLKNELYRALYPEILPREGEGWWRQDSMCLTRTKASPEGTFEAVGILTKVVSRHYNLIIQDDTVAPDLDEITADNIMPTKDDIGKAIGWHRLATPLLTDQLTDQIIVVGTRWFPQDLIQHILDHEKYFKTYIRACRETDGVPDENGTPTFPAMFPEEILQRLIQKLGPYLFSCLYMNKPVRSGDMVFNPALLQYYEQMPRNLLVYVSIDPAGDPEETKGDDPDYNVIMVAARGMYDSNVYVLEYDRRRMNPGDMIDSLFKLCTRYKPLKVMIESVAYQNTLIYHIKQAQKKYNYFFPVEAITHGRKSKNARIMGLQPLVFNKLLYIKAYMMELYTEFVQFPLGKHDDVLDALSMCVKFFQGLRILPKPKREGVNGETVLDFDPTDLAKDLRHKKGEKRGLMFDLIDGKYDPTTFFMN